MAYSKGTATSINGDVKTRRVNPARVAAGRMIPTTGGMQRFTVPVARKPAKNKAAK